MNKVFAVAGLASLLVCANASAAHSVAEGLPSASYTQSGVYGFATAESAFNGGGWNAGGFGDQWVQVDLGATKSVFDVNFFTGQLPDGVTSYQVFVADSFIGNNWTSLTSVASLTSYTVNGTNIDLSFAPTSARYLEIVANGGPSWTSIDRITVQAVPEPETYALLLAGMGVVATFARRKKIA